MNITENIYLLEASSFSNIFLIKSANSILIDTGMPGKEKKILKELERLNVPPKTISHILLTHHDVDHVGNVKRLQEATGATVWIGIEDTPYLMGKKKRPGIKHIIQSVMKVCEPSSYRNFENSPVSLGIQAIPTPGHTPGHYIFQYNSTIFTGDLFKYKNSKFVAMSERMNWDKNKLISSLSLLQTLSFEWICPSHGIPVKNSDEFQYFINKECGNVGKYE
jgi:glyoxylase-like metal-dependent hydrolase (beta-lactamase superfamily II)